MDRNSGNTAVRDVVRGHVGKVVVPIREHPGYFPGYTLGSLLCVKRHKVESGCDGRRCKTTYISLSDFDDNQLHSGESLLVDHLVYSYVRGG